MTPSTSTIDESRWVDHSPTQSLCNTQKDRGVCHDKGSMMRSGSLRRSQLCTYFIFSSEGRTLLKSLQSLQGEDLINYITDYL